MFDSHTQFRNAVEDHAIYRNSLQHEPFRIGLSFPAAEDISSNAAGHLFDQDKDFFIVQVEIEREEPQVGMYSFKRVTGGLSCYFCTKGDQQDREYWAQVEQFARWFSGRNIKGAVCRGLLPGLEVRHNGFRVYPIDVPFEFRLNLES